MHPMHPIPNAALYHIYKILFDFGSQEAWVPCKLAYQAFRLLYIMSIGN